jgi:hypothetical protein
MLWKREKSSAPATNQTPIPWSAQYSNWATGWMTEELGFDSWWGQKIYLISIAPRPALVFTVRTGAVSSGINWQGHEIDSSLPSGA